MTDKLIKGLDKLQLNFSEEQITKLEGYINEVLEFAPGKVLAGLAKRCDSSLKGISLGDAESLKNYL